MIINGGTENKIPFNVIVFRGVAFSVDLSLGSAVSKSVPELYSFSQSCLTVKYSKPRSESDFVFVLKFFSISISEKSESLALFSRHLT